MEVQEDLCDFFIAHVVYCDTACDICNAECTAIVGNSEAGYFFHCAMCFEDFVVVCGALECEEITCSAADDEVFVVHCHAFDLAAECFLLTLVDCDIDSVYEFESDLLFFVFAFHVCELEVACAQFFREDVFGLVVGMVVVDVMLLGLLGFFEGLLLCVCYIVDLVEFDGKCLEFFRGIVSY